jgi:Ni,Fe-hydrogenase III small subunit/NAD-dependent dihydropyrimidine dehydrogenase PreA subunit
MLQLLKGLNKIKIVTEEPATWGEGMGRGLPTVNMQACKPGCNNCEAVCPTGAMAGKAVDPKACIYCHSCRQVCPTGAIEETEIPVLFDAPPLETAGHLLRERIKKVCKRSLHIRYVDAGACNGCDFEINAVLNPIYDIQQYGIDFVASPRHADMLLVTGVVTRNLEVALQKTLEACPRPTLVVAVGACACGGGIFKEAYAAGGGVDKHAPVDVYVPGCPPTPSLIIKGILTAINRLV